MEGQVIHSNGPHSIISFKCRKLSVKVRALGFSPLNGFPQLPQPLGSSLKTSGKKGRVGGGEGEEGERGCPKSPPHLVVSPSFHFYETWTEACLLLLPQAEVRCSRGFGMEGSNTVQVASFGPLC